MATSKPASLRIEQAQHEPATKLVIHVDGQRIDIVILDGFSQLDRFELAALIARGELRRTVSCTVHISNDKGDISDG